MSADVGDSGGGAGARFEFLQPGRDPESNWEVDLAQKLEEYLLRICSGEVLSPEEGALGHLSVNFAEAALVVQGSIQVYSRKVEYLYSLVLHALEFLSQRSKEENQQSGDGHNDADDNIINAEEDDELFFGLEEVAVEERNCLNDDSSNVHEAFGYPTKPPANLVVLEGDSLDTSGDATEMESYLMATCDVYEDFLLLDLSDAGAVREYLKGTKSINENVGDGSCRSNIRRGSVSSHTGQSGGKSTERSGRSKTHQISGGSAKLGNGNLQFESSSNDPNLWKSNLHHDGVEQDNDISECVGSFSDDYDEEDDDPWKPLNPHEPGDLKVKPFKKVKPRKQLRGPNARNSILLDFPVATVDRILHPQFDDILKNRSCSSSSSQVADSFPFFEKLRRTLVVEEFKVVDDPIGAKTSLDENNDNDHPNLDDFGFDDNVDIDEDSSLPHEKANFNDVDFDAQEAFGREELNTQAGLEDLCRAHLDDLLKNMTEAETQTEMAARVMTWKQGIGQALEEQEAHPPFDIHDYGKKILDKWSPEANEGSQVPFTEIVKGCPDYDVARTFSALLQLVNDRNLDLECGKSGGESVCYTAEKPFHVRLVSHKGREFVIRSSKKRTKSASKKDHGEKTHGENPSDVDLHSLSPSSSKTLQTKNRLALKFGKGNASSYTPEGKRRRRARLVNPMDLPSAR